MQMSVCVCVCLHFNHSRYWYCICVCFFWLWRCRTSITHSSGGDGGSGGIMRKCILQNYFFYLQLNIFYINSIQSNVGRSIIRYSNMAGHCSNFNIHWTNDTLLFTCNHNSSTIAKNDTGMSCRFFVVILHNKQSA